MIGRARQRLDLSTALILIAVVISFLALWGPELIGNRALIGGDILRACCLPWSAQPGVHRPGNSVLFDGTIDFLPWLQVVRDAFAHGRLPLWDPYAFSGTPLLANDQSAPFSPFTLIALPFAPAQGMTLAMLAKLWVAGGGMAFFVRSLGTRREAALVAGIVFATSSFLVVWLSGPPSSVAALLPWSLAFVERWLQVRGASALVGLALSLALGLLAGHAETSLHVAFGLSLYCAIRLGWCERRLTALGGLLGAAVLGLLLSGVQLLPFLHLLSESAVSADRASEHLGFQHLSPRAVSTWLVPNAVGNPAIDRANGWAPNYSEATGFAGVTALLLAGVGAISGWGRRRPATVALVSVGLLSVLVVYGPLSQLAGRLPGLSVSYNPRLLLLVCTAVAALSGLGIDALLEGVTPPRLAFLGRTLLAVGVIAVAGMATLGVVLLVRGAAVATMLPKIAAGQGFWVLLAAVSVLAAIALIAAALCGARVLAAGGLVTAVLLEAAIFAGPYNPRTELSDVPPASTVTSWLQDHAGEGAVAGVGQTLIAQTETLYGLHDVRGYDLLKDRRVRIFWSHADPGYSDDPTIGLTQLFRPDAAWLARAGVAYFVSPAGQIRPGTQAMLSAEGVTVAAVPDHRPFVEATERIVPAANAEDAANKLTDASLDATVVENMSASDLATGSVPARVGNVQRQAGEVAFTVDSDAPALVVIRQSYSPDWNAEMDGRTTTLLPADVLFQAVRVPRGHHLVTLRYQPAAVSVGLLVSGAGVLLTAALGVFTAYARARKNPVRAAAWSRDRTSTRTP